MNVCAVLCRMMYVFAQFSCGMFSHIYKILGMYLYLSRYVHSHIYSYQCQNENGNAHVFPFKPKMSIGLFLPEQVYLLAACRGKTYLLPSPGAVLWTTDDKWNLWVLAKCYCKVCKWGYAPHEINAGEIWLAKQG